jgi:hypothetical protein
VQTTPAALPNVIKTEVLRFVGAPPATSPQLQVQPPPFLTHDAAGRFQPKPAKQQTSQIRQQHAPAATGFAAGMSLPADASTPAATTSVIKTQPLVFVGNSSLPAALQQASQQGQFPQTSADNTNSNLALAKGSMSMATTEAEDSTDPTPDAVLDSGQQAQATVNVIKTQALTFIGNYQAFKADKNLMPGIKTDNF